jgi:HD-like signal output (HDOD) protein
VSTNISPSGSQSAEILKIAASLGLLGASAASGARLMTTLCNPGIDAREVKGLIESEPGLCARALRVANSPYYGQPRTITSVDRALTVLGLDGLRGIAAAACLNRAIGSQRKALPIDLQALLRHSLAAAAAAQALAQARSPTLASEAFIAGLLHDFGIAVQVRLDAAGMNALLDARRADPAGPIAVLERDCVAVGHEDCTGVIFEAWQLPPSIVAAAGCHHDPLSAPPEHRDLAALVHLGAHLALASGHTFELEPMPMPEPGPTLEWLDIDRTTLDGVLMELPSRTADLWHVLM